MATLLTRWTCAALRAAAALLHGTAERIDRPGAVALPLEPLAAAYEDELAAQRVRVLTRV